jgi:hypothetical protein
MDIELFDLDDDLFNTNVYEFFEFISPPVPINPRKFMICICGMTVNKIKSIRKKHMKSDDHKHNMKKQFQKYVKFLNDDTIDEKYEIEEPLIITI